MKRYLCSITKRTGKDELFIIQADDKHEALIKAKEKVETDVNYYFERRNCLDVKVIGIVQNESNKNHKGTPVPVFAYVGRNDFFEFRKYLESQYPDFVIDDVKYMPNDHMHHVVLKAPSKAAARRIAKENGMPDRRSTYWINKFYKFYDDETGENIKIFIHFYYEPKRVKGVL